VSARAVPAPKHKTADTATPSAERTRFFVGLQRFTLRVLSAIAVPPTVCGPQSSKSGDPTSARHAAHLRAFSGTVPQVVAGAPHYGELLTVAEVAAMTRLSEGTSRYWRSVGADGPESFKLGRRVMHRRVDVEKWLEEAR